MRYRSIPVYVEAEVWSAGHDVPGVEPAAKRWPPGSPEYREQFPLWGVVDTPAGPAIVRPGDYVVTHEDGSRTAVAWDQFFRLYAAVPPKIERQGLRYAHDED